MNVKIYIHLVYSTKQLDLEGQAVSIKTACFTAFAVNLIFPANNCFLSDKILAQNRSISNDNHSQMVEHRIAKIYTQLVHITKNQNMQAQVVSFINVCLRAFAVNVKFPQKRVVK